MKYILLRNGIKQNGYGKWGYKIVFPLYISGEGKPMPVYQSTIIKAAHSTKKHERNFALGLGKPVPYSFFSLNDNNGNKTIICNTFDASEKSQKSLLKIEFSEGNYWFTVIDNKTLVESKLSKEYFDKLINTNRVNALTLALTSGDRLEVVLIDDKTEQFTPTGVVLRDISILGDNSIYSKMRSMKYESNKGGEDNRSRASISSYTVEQREKPDTTEKEATEENKEQRRISDDTEGQDGWQREQPSEQPEGCIENILEQAKQDEHIEDTEDKKITSVENLKKLVESQADETKDTNTEEIDRLDKVRHAALSKEENSRYFDEYTPDNILKILSNLEENDRVTIKTDSLNPIGISIIRIIDSSPDSLQRIELMRLSIDKINTAYFLGKSNDTVGICTLQLIGRTDRNAGVDLEEFCVKYNVWAQRTKYMSI
jgi:hypothetical protein